VRERERGREGDIERERERKSQREREGVRERQRQSLFNVRYKEQVQETQSSNERFQATRPTHIQGCFAHKKQRPP